MKHFTSRKQNNYKNFISKHNGKWKFNNLQKDLKTNTFLKFIFKTFKIKEN